MWYAVETAFIDGRFLGSRCLFVDGDETSSVGHCFANDHEPVNQCQKEFGDRIELHTDWFESEELAHAFCDGNITYIHHYEAITINQSNDPAPFSEKGNCDGDEEKGLSLIGEFTRII